MKKLIFIALCFAMVLSLAACGSKTIETEADSVPSCKTIDFEAQYIRTNASSYDGDNDNALWITSIEELNDYYQQNKDRYYLESVENPGSDQTIGFVDAVKKYDEAFFEKNDLILIVFDEPSGSNRHEVAGVDLFTSSQDRDAYFIQPNIERIVPEVGTCDMATWHIIIEIDKEYGKDFAQLKYPNITVNGPGGDARTVREDVCALYLEVLEDLWNVDSGLNGGISQIGIDLSELSHLTEVEKDTVMSEFASKHNLPYLVGTWDELCEQGFIDKENLRWEDGLFFSIKTNEDAVWNLPAIKVGDPIPELTSFDAQKWRSGLGAYFFDQCTAQKNADGTWTYTVGQEAIS